MSRRQVAQSFLTMAPDGSVAARFPGGVLLSQVKSPNEHSPVVPEKGVVWNSANGALVAQIFGSDTNPTNDSQAAIQTQAISPQGRYTTLFVSSDDTDPAKQVVGLFLPGIIPVPSRGATIMDGNGKSKFIQVAGTRNVVEYGPFTLAVPALAAQTGTSFLTLASGLPGSATAQITVHGAMNGATAHIVTWGYTIGGVPGAYVVSVAFYNAYIAAEAGGTNSLTAWVRVEEP